MIKVVKDFWNNGDLRSILYLKAGENKPFKGFGYWEDGKRLEYTQQELDDMLIENNTFCYRSGNLIKIDKNNIIIPDEPYTK